MIPGRIEREVMIQAPVETVWQIVTEPNYITEWFGDEIEFDSRPQGKGTLTFYMDDGEHKTQPFMVDAIEPTSRFALRWCYEDAVDRPTNGNSLLIEFLLNDEGDKTRLQVIESGFDTMSWDEATTKATYDDHTNGWNVIVGRLVDYANRTHA